MFLIARPIPSRVGLDFAKQLFTPTIRSGHYLIWATVFGASLWQGSIGAYTAFQALPRRDFGRLQAKLFPVYFALTSGGTALLAASFFVVHHGRILKSSTPASDPTIVQSIFLATASAAQALNYFVVGRRATQVMFKRHALEAAEGKDYNDPTVSPQMKELSKRFGTLHGYSTMLNMTVFVALTVQGFWLANFGL
ncbi:hypothetical protein A4X13_0g784 [Tilletia indica]|uniref:TMEM205-like domain-containing protein n=1 Tax=Tilletia indica TaxID=43049 RepID=A0A177TSF6_9BASI|nr:hypothetical protein A4X13_0g784 [Tilletia indica]